MLLHDPLNRVEAEPGAFSRSLRGEERLENMRQYFG
jgi:hypothetical protein